MTYQFEKHTTKQNKIKKAIVALKKQERTAKRNVKIHEPEKFNATVHTEIKNYYNKGLPLSKTVQIISSSYRDLFALNGVQFSLLEMYLILYKRNRLPPSDSLFISQRTAHLDKEIPIRAFASIHKLWMAGYLERQIVTMLKQQSSVSNFISAGGVHNIIQAYRKRNFNERNRGDVSHQKLNTVNLNTVLEILSNTELVLYKPKPKLESLNTVWSNVPIRGRFLPHSEFIKLKQFTMLEPMIDWDAIEEEYNMMELDYVNKNEGNNTESDSLISSNLNTGVINTNIHDVNLDKKEESIQRGNVIPGEHDIFSELSSGLRIPGYGQIQIEKSSKVDNVNNVNDIDINIATELTDIEDTSILSKNEILNDDKEFVECLPEVSDSEVENNEDVKDNTKEQLPTEQESQENLKDLLS